MIHPDQNTKRGFFRMTIPLSVWKDEDGEFLAKIFPALHILRWWPMRPKWVVWLVSQFIRMRVVAVHTASPGGEPESVLIYATGDWRWK